MSRFPLRLRQPWRTLLLPWGVSAGRGYVEIDGPRLRARFGFFRLSTTLENVERFDVTGPYRWWRAIGYRLSLHDHGATFGSDPQQGVCIRFRSPVKGALFSHSALTVTVDDPGAFATALRRHGIPGADARDAP